MKGFCYSVLLFGLVIFALWAVTTGKTWWPAPLVATALPYWGLCRLQKASTAPATA
ncbi:MAG: hypothetical protein Q7S64_00135 [bacterium]|nr:hypothetical protein [bacterium]